MALNTIFAAFERELGPEIPQMIMEIEKEYTKKNFSSLNLNGTEEDYRILFNPQDFGIKGWGNPVEVKKENTELRVRIDNPFNASLLAGKIGGYYEAIEKIEAKVQWMPNTEGYTIITVSPKNTQN